ncbi:hypothetical protein NKI32_03795 [Mesorhizobium sp. M0761]|uniref:hypothetical protein n=1 Tax=Mesorhizobium sp. M0761 TaxID=2956994 RepID=UPI00333750F4
MSDKLMTRPKLKFRTYRPRVPRNGIRVDDALDAIGSTLFPDWGHLAGFENLPLFASRKLGLFTLDPKDRRRFTKRTVEDTQAARIVLEQYRLTISHLYDAFVLPKKVPAYTVSDEGVKRALNAGLLNRQRVAVFGAGIVKRVKGERTTREPVWIEKAPFRKWLRDEFTPKRPLSQREFDRVVEALDIILDTETFRNLKKKDVEVLIQRLLGIRATSDWIANVMIGVPSKRKGGRPMTEAKWSAIVDRFLAQSRSPTTTD